MTKANEWGTDGLVPGIRIRMSSKELATHLAARAEYHAKREAEKQKILPQVQKAADEVKAHQPASVVAHFNKSGMSNYRFDGDDAVENLKQDIETHHNKSIAFRFIAEHLFEHDYCLERADLVTLEILKHS